MDLCGGMPQYSLERNHELHGVKMVDVMVPMSRKAGPAWDHKPHIRVDIHVMVVNAEVSRTLVLVVSDVLANVLAR